MVAAKSLSSALMISMMIVDTEEVVEGKREKEGNMEESEQKSKQGAEEGVRYYTSCS